MKEIKIDPDMHFRVLNLIYKNPLITQRELAKKLDVSLGGINYCLKALILIGHLKIKTFQANPNKSTYLYLLTAKGMKEKSLLTVSFIQRKMKEYKALKNEINEVKNSLGKS